MTANPIYPNIKVRLSAENENVFLIVNAVSKAMRKKGANEADIKAFYDEASTDIAKATQAARKWINVIWTTNTE